MKLLYPKQAALPALVYNIWRCLKFSVGPANKSIWNNFELILGPDVAPMSVSHVDFTGEEVFGVGWMQQMGRIQKSWVDLFEKKELMYPDNKGIHRLELLKSPTKVCVIYEPIC